ncbi:hypothetical protein, partial [Klebsiella pneumoniae]|uniref:hypothetical protein n=1 Tax=Klebsiella pneumoniae TaxID=573 RepID=UPI00405577FC
TDGDGSHGSTSKTPSYTKSVSWHHYPLRWYRCVSHSVLISSEAFTTAFRAQSGAAADRKIK